MRLLARIVIATAAIALGASGARAQESQEAPALPESAPIVAPHEEPAALESEPAVEAAPLAAAAEAPGRPPASSTEPELAAPAVEVAPLSQPAPGLPSVGTLTGDWRAAGEDAPRGQRPSDWVFLGIVAMAVIVIIVRLTREKRESVSIHDDRANRQSPSPSLPGPPIVRHS